uniref:ORF58 n=1 Tax=Malaco herpesvirus 1 TaxID=3031797 RepID=A0AA48P7S6_9VIRU|nr:TPA_asm: ORF58 [Malaco herpesvirus 1]
MFSSTILGVITLLYVVCVTHTRETLEITENEFRVTMLHFTTTYDQQPFSLSNKYFSVYINAPTGCRIDASHSWHNCTRDNTGKINLYGVIAGATDYMDKAKAYTNPWTYKAYSHNNVVARTVNLTGGIMGLSGENVPDLETMYVNTYHAASDTHHHIYGCVVGDKGKIWHPDPTPDATSRTYKVPFYPGGVRGAEAMFVQDVYGRYNHSNSPYLKECTTENSYNRMVKETFDLPNPRLQRWDTITDVI